MKHMMKTDPFEVCMIGIQESNEIYGPSWWISWYIMLTLIVNRPWNGRFFRMWQDGVCILTRWAVGCECWISASTRISWQLRQYMYIYHMVHAQKHILATMPQMFCGRFEIYLNILMVPACRGLVLLKSGYCGEVARKNLFFHSSGSFGRLARIWSKTYLCHQV